MTLGLTRKIKIQTCNNRNFASPETHTRLKVRLDSLYKPALTGRNREIGPAFHTIHIDDGEKEECNHSLLHQKSFLDSNFWVAQNCSQIS